MFKHFLHRAIFLAFALPGVAHAADVTVFAAASLTEVLQRIGTAYTRKSGETVVYSFAGTATLARQIEAGARADVFISADAEWMDGLATRGLVEPSTRRDVFATRLVLIAPADTKTTLNISQRFPLAASLGANGRLSLADPQSVPAGRYAKTALTALGVWDEVATRIAVSDNVRTAMSFVARGEAPLGIVYETDARVEARVKVLGVFPADSHPPIHYPAAVVRGGDDKGFLTFLASAEARAIAVQSGFTIPADLRR
ncbi:MAG: molybdate ABC transporter substrate-binding protein [Gammaproteobacteria bacterium]|nr:molybdate ABC transporter substrate-binding protein [Gammaproteobacteria bacterium]